MKKKSMNLITAVAVLVVLSGAYVGVKTLCGQTGRKRKCRRGRGENPGFLHFL